MKDLDLAGDLPTGSTQTSIDIAGAPGMDQIILRSGDDERLAGHEIQLDAEAVGDPDHQVERWIRPSALDRGDVCPRHADRVRQGLLGDVEHRSGVKAQTRERHS